MLNIKKQENKDTEKGKKKRWAWFSLCIGFASIAILVISIVVINLRNESTPPSTIREGVHYTNSYEIGGRMERTSPSLSLPLVWYSIDIEKDHYDYNEEFIIIYSIHCFNDDYCIADDKVLDINILSDKFQFSSPTEYHFDLETDISVYENVISFGNEQKDTIFPIVLELKAKAVQQCDFVESMQFLLKFPLKDYFIESLIKFGNAGETYKSLSDEFTKDFAWIQRIYYINDELGTILVDSGKDFSDPDLASSAIFGATTETMYRSLNRLYSNTSISKSEYMKKIIEFFTKNKPYLDCWWTGMSIHDMRRYFYYYSKNFRAKFKLNAEYDYLFELYQKDEKNRISVTKELLKILYEEDKITLEEYNNEITLIDEEGLLLDRSWEGAFSSYNSKFIPFDDYLDYYFDIYLEKID